jgi:hypothetical protein
LVTISFVRYGWKRTYQTARLSFPAY